jgi:prophage regulatory protein
MDAASQAVAATLMMEPIMGRIDQMMPTGNSNNNDNDNLPQGRSLSQLVVANPLPFRRTIRRTELRQIVPLADTTIYDMERRGEFPRRFNLTARCVVWDLTEVETWLVARRQASDTSQLKRAPSPDVRQRKRRPVKSAPVL